MRQSKKVEISVEGDADIEKLCIDTVDLVEYARNIAVQQVNMVQLLTYYSIGKWIVDVQQKGESRARVRSLKNCQIGFRKSLVKGFQKQIWNISDGFI